MVGFAMTTVCAVIDVYFVGLLGSDAVAGMTLLMAFAGILSTTNSVVGGGSVAVISRRHGENDGPGTAHAIKQTVLLKFWLGVLSCAIGLPLIRVALGWMNAEPAAAALGGQFGVWFFLAMPFWFCSWTIFTALRGI